MNEPLFDRLTAVSAFFAVAAVLALRPADPPPANVDRIKQRQIAGLALLMLSVGLLLYRWIGSVVTVPADLRLGTFRDALISATCGLGIAAAILSVTATKLADRVKSFLAVAACGAVALMVAAAWEWALLWISLLAFGCWAVLRITQRLSDKWAGEDPAEPQTVEDPGTAGASPSRNPASQIVSETLDETPREPGLIMLAATAVLVLLLGTWQHVVTNESQRNTRSQRYSAWPRATALANAWERSGWVMKLDENNSTKLDRASTELVTTLATREQHIAWGLGAMLLVVAGVAWRQSKAEPQEHPHEC